MATTTKYVSLDNLSLYDEKIKGVITEGDEAVKTYVDTKIETRDPAGSAATALENANKYTDEKVAENATAIEGVQEAVDAIEADYLKSTDKTELQGNIDTLEETVEENAEAAKVTLATAETATDGYLKTYVIKQGITEVGKIDIPKELVVTAGEVVVNPEGLNEGTYIKLTIANQDEPIYINVKDLCDVYTAEQNAVQVQVAISDTNVVSAIIVAGSVGTTELADGAVTAGKLADDTKALFDEAGAAEQALTDAKTYVDGLDSAMDTRVKELEQAVGTEGAVADLIATAKQEAIDTAADDATTKANQALTDAKAYTDEKDTAMDDRMNIVEGKAHEHANKELLDTYTQTEENLADAVAKKHAHENATVLDGVTAEKVAAWDVAEQNAKDYADELIATFEEASSDDINDLFAQA